CRRWAGCPSPDCLHVRKKGIAFTMNSGSVVDRKALAELEHAIAHTLFDLSIPSLPAVRHSVHHFGDPVANLLEFCGTETARCAGRRSQPDAGGDRRFFVVEGYRVFVAGD